LRLIALANRLQRLECLDFGSDLTSLLEKLFNLGHPYYGVSNGYNNRDVELNHSPQLLIFNATYGSSDTAPSNNTTPPKPPVSDAIHKSSNAAASFNQTPPQPHLLSYAEQRYHLNTGFNFTVTQPSSCHPNRQSVVMMDVPSLVQENKGT
jgi:hypothetical protein